MIQERFIQGATEFRELLQRQEDLRQDIAAFEERFKGFAALTNPQVATTKRILKAEIKGTLDKLQTKMEDDAVLLGILAMPPQKKSSQKKSAVVDVVLETEWPHDPETGEITDPAAWSRQEAPTDAGGLTVASADPQPPTVEREEGDSADDNPCPPIPLHLRRSA